MPPIAPHEWNWTSQAQRVILFVDRLLELLSDVVYHSNGDKVALQDISDEVERRKTMDEQFPASSGAHLRQSCMTPSSLLRCLVSILLHSSMLCYYVNVWSAICGAFFDRRRWTNDRRQQPFAVHPSALLVLIMARILWRDLIKRLKYNVF